MDSVRRDNAARVLGKLWVTLNTAFGQMPYAESDAEQALRRMALIRLSETIATIEDWISELGSE